jgi:hypothetical protein
MICADPLRKPGSPPRFWDAASQNTMNRTGYSTMEPAADQRRDLRGNSTAVSRKPAMQTMMMNE